MCVSNILHCAKLHLEGAFQVIGTMSVPGMETASFSHKGYGNQCSYPVHPLFHQTCCVANINKPVCNIYYLDLGNISLHKPAEYQ